MPARSVFVCYIDTFSLTLISPVKDGWPSAEQAALQRPDWQVMQVSGLVQFEQAVVRRVQETQRV